MEKVLSGMPVAAWRTGFGTIIKECHMVWVPGSLVAKLARNAAGVQASFMLKCKRPGAKMGAVRTCPVRVVTEAR